MKAIYFDCFSGISGDMTVAAMLDLGIDKDKFLKEMDKLNFSEYEIEITPKEVNGINGTDFLVKYPHSHIHRNLNDINEIIDNSELEDSVKAMAKNIFLEVALAESKVHNRDLSEVHFHEVGAVDSIVDIVATAVCFDLLGVDVVYSSKLNDGTGFINCQHGEIPVPVPAVVQMLKDSNIPYNILDDVTTELVTPTGMAIIKTAVSKFGNMPNMNITEIGYGMGKRDTGRFNSLRVYYGDVAVSDADDVILIETNIDDCTSEILGYTMDKLLEMGAKDVYFVPIYMKKNRPAYLFKVICSSSMKDEVIYTIFKETSSIGVRIIPIDRVCMDREEYIKPTSNGNIKIKKSSYKDIIKEKVEFEDCKKIAEEKNIPVRKVIEDANV